MLDLDAWTSILEQIAVLNDLYRVSRTCRLVRLACKHLLIPPLPKSLKKAPLAQTLVGQRLIRDLAGNLLLSSCQSSITFQLSTTPLTIAAISASVINIDLDAETWRVLSRLRRWWSCAPFSISLSPTPCVLCTDGKEAWGVSVGDTCLFLVRADVCDRKPSMTTTIYVDTILVVRRFSPEPLQS